MWKSYFISVELPQHSRVRSGIVLVHSEGGPVHTEGFYVIDANGKERRYFGGDTTVEELVQYLETVVSK